MNRIASCLPFLGVLAATLGASSAEAGFVTGRVVDALGVGVADVDLDARDSSGGGGDVTLVNDGTDVNGYFTTTFPAGSFEITFNPPRPPASNGLLTYLTPVTVTTTGTTNVGTIVLNPGVALSGHISNPLGAAVFGINFDVIDASGDNVALLYDETDTLGNFAFAAPAGPIQFRIDPSGVSGQVLAPSALELNVSTDTNLGVIQLQQGFVVTALCRTPSATAINGLDVDVFDPVTGLKRYTPGDSSNASGLVDFVVPAGNWNIDFFPPFALHLAAVRLNRTIGATTNLGIVTCPNGWIMSGTLRSCAGTVVPFGNVDLRATATQVDLPVSNDSANAAGFYQVIVPQSAPLDVHFKGPTGGGLAVDIHAAITPLANFTLDGVLGPEFTAFCFGDGSGTACPCGNHSPVGGKSGCTSSLGTGGKLEAFGRACVSGDTMVLRGSQMTNSSALYFQGTTQANGGLGSVFGDGKRCAGGAVTRLGTKVNVAGGSAYPVAGDLSISVKGLVVAGATRTYQTWYRNAAAFCNPETFNLTNGVQVTWVP